jgi:hypothetical protein
MAKVDDESEETTEDEWYEDYENIKWLGKVLQEAGYFDDQAEQNLYFQKPWKWNDEWAAWAELGNPTSDDKDWNKFIDKLNEL